MFVKIVGKLQSLPLLLTSVRRTLRVVVEDFMLLIALHQNVWGSKCPPGTTTVAQVDHLSSDHCKNTFCLVNFLDGTPDLASDLLPFK